MQMMKHYFSLLLGFLLVPLSMIAEVLKEGVDVSYDFYSDNVGVIVNAPVIGMKKMISEKWGVIANLRIDAITAASMYYASGKKSDKVIVDAVTGASDRPFDDLRVAPDLGFVYESGMSRTDFGFYGSTERDYNVFAVRMSEQLSFNDANTIFSLGGVYSFEKWDPAINRKLDKKAKHVYSVNAALTQLLNPHAYIALNFEYTMQTGMLSSPYRYINTPTYGAFDKYPDRRQSFPVALTYVQQLGEDFATHLSYRFFADTWEMTSHTADAKVYYDVSDSVTLGMRGRYYTQSGVGFIKPLDEYSPDDDPDYVVGEYKYSEFSAYSAGMSLFYRPAFIEDENIVLKMSGNYYVTTDNSYIKAWYGEDNVKAIYSSLSFNYEF